LLLIQKKIITCLFFFVTILFSCISEDTTIAYNYYRQALPYISANKDDSAVRLLTKALEFYPQCADAYFQLSKIYLKKDKTLMQGLTLLRQALSLEHWQYNSAISAKKELAHILYRIKEYNEAEKILTDLHTSSATDAGTEILLIKTLKYVNKPEVLYTVIATALKKFPAEKELYVLAAENSFQNNQLAEAVRLIDIALNTIPGSRELLFYKIKYITDNEQKKALLDEYLKLDKALPEAAFTAIEVDPENSTEYIDFFMKKGGSRYLDLRRRMFILLESDEELSAHFQDTNPEKYLDRNQDGFYEERFIFTDDGIAKLFIDDDQNGIEEWIIDFTNEQPVTLRQWDNTRYITYTYSIHPFLKSISYPDKNFSSEYLIIPFTTEYPIIEITEKYYYNINKQIAPYTEEQSRQIAYRQNLFNNQTLFETRELHNNTLTAKRLDTDNDGIMDYTIEYKNDKPVKAFRDFDNDGINDAIEYYTNGILSTIEFDENHDNIPESIQYYDASESSIITTWDYNSDGQFDARQTVTGNETLYELAPKYDNNFDLKIQFKEGKITSVMRGKKTTAVVRDELSNLYWIGKRGKSFKGIMQLTPGKHSMNGKKYFIFRHGNEQYIEEIE